MLENTIVKLRPLEPEDCNRIYEWENNSNFWEVSNTILPFSKHLINEFIDNSHNDLFMDRQFRFMLDRKDLNKTIGCVDLFEFDPFHKRVGIGLLIADKDDRGNGFASEALDLIKEFCFDHLGIHQMFCNILEENTVSCNLFKSKGFIVVGVKKDWILSKGIWHDELLFQLINRS